MPQMTKEQSLEALDSATAAWDGGSGVWPQLSLADRIDAIQNFMVDLKKKREDIVTVLMYEIGKNKPTQRQNLIERCYLSTRPSSTFTQL